MKKTTFIIFIFLTLSNSFLNSEEVSAFSAGNLDDVTPYGLDETEQHILTNKQRINIIDTKQKNLDVKISGLMSVVQGVNVRNNNIGLEIKQISKDVESLTLVVEQIKQQVSKNQQQIVQFSKSFNSFKQIQSSNVQALKEALKKINLSLKSQESKILKLQRKQLITSNKRKSEANSKKQSKIIDKEKSFQTAVKKFNIDHLTNAKKIFIQLIELNYKVVECNFYLGEINFFKKKYATAIAYYKSSMKDYKGKKYVPTLLLHSGIAFENLGDKSNAIKFYETLIDNYVSSKEAIVASDNLLKLQNN